MHQAIERSRSRECEKRASRSKTVIVMLSLAGCSQNDIPSQADIETLVDITAEAGLVFRHDSGVRGDYLLPEIMGSGVALFDYDNDGDLDVYLVDSGSLDEPAASGSNRLFRQMPDGTFVDATEEAGIGDRGYGMGNAVGDIDNDGDLDLYVANYRSDRLYRNNGDGKFSDITEGAGIEGSRWSTSAAFCDIDLDGYLDLYVTTYVDSEPPVACTSNAGEADYCGPVTYRGVPDQLYRNNGDGTFSETGTQSGISEVVNNGLGVVCFDFNDDARSDFLVANDGERNHLWINGGDGKFENRSIAFGVAVNLFGETEASMGIALGDVDGDLGLDVFLTHLDQETNTLYLTTGAGVLMDGTVGSGLGIASTPYTGFGTAFFDADHDGDLDLAIANGRVRRGPHRWMSSGPEPLAPEALGNFHRIYAEPNLLMANVGRGKFQDYCVEADEFCRAVEVSRGLLTGDIDRDGDLDILVTSSNGPVRLFRNNIPKNGGWLMLRVIDPQVNRDAIGALATIRLGDERIVRPVIHTRSYLSSGDATVHFGLGQADRVDAIEITWPDGVHERFSGVAGNRSVEVRRGEGSSIPSRDAP